MVEGIPTLDRSRIPQKLWTEGFLCVFASLRLCVKSTASQYTVVPGEIRIALSPFAFPQSPQRLAGLPLDQLLRDLPDLHKRRQITWLLEVTARAQRKTALSVLR